MFAVSPRETIPVSESARLLGLPHQVENELMNHCRFTLRQEITSGCETKTRGGSDSVAKRRVDSAWICGPCCFPSSFLRCVRNHVVRCSFLPGFMYHTHVGRSSCCARFVCCSSLSSSLWVRRNRPGMAYRERNKKMHDERGNIKMVVANVTALQRHWPIFGQAKS